MEQQKQEEQVQEEQAEEVAEAATEENQIVIVNNIQSPAPPGPSRSVTLYGDITECAARTAVGDLLYFSETAELPPLEEGGESEFLPINMYISTYGGSVLEMFSIYDIMSQAKQRTTVKTYGLGKVMSAGVLLLASGTKGERHIGKNCRVMLHSAASAAIGPVFNMKNEMSEAFYSQKRYIKRLSQETKLSKRQIKKFLNKKIDFYFSAEEAIEFGIADKII